MSEYRENLWAPWRMQYLRGLHPQASGECFLCRYRDQADRDGPNHVVWRTPHCIVLMNRFPYTNGHLLIASAAHKPDLEALDREELREISDATRDALLLLSDVLEAEGFNIGLNLGASAGAGLPGHIHWHVVPRWSGDTNYMSVVADVRVIPQALDELYARLRERAAALGLPRARDEKRR